MPEMTKYKQAEDQAAIVQYLKDTGYRIIEDKCSDGWIRWRHNHLEGVVRITAHKEWEILADPTGQWDRCANTTFCTSLPAEICNRSLELAFFRLDINE